MASIDFSVLASAFLGFLFFFLVHVILFRSQRLERASSILIISFGIGLIADMVLSGAFLLSEGFHASALLEAVLAIALSMILYGFFVFHYIAWIYGMGEAAIRIRLLCEIDQFPGKRASLSQVLERYNAAYLLERRLVRLLGPGHLKTDGVFYQIGNPALLFHEKIAKMMKKILGV